MSLMPVAMMVIWNLTTKAMEETVMMVEMIHLTLETLLMEEILVILLVAPMAVKKEISKV